jgi:ethanolamine ammonia-lyase small subunit
MNTAAEPSIIPATSLRTRLRTLTPARVALGQTGVSITTNELLDFQLAHARARDAVHASLQPASLLAALRTIPYVPEVLLLHSAAPDRATYLQRPDLGRRLDEPSHQRLHDLCQPNPPDLAIVLADGLSALAVERHAAPLLAELLPALAPLHPAPICPAPICIVQQGRVAVADEVAHILNTPLAIILIGERPGLSSPDSLGAYITSRPQPGLTTDAERNCISNIRTEGLSYTQAAGRFMHYITEARKHQLTGIALKDPDPAGSSRQLESAP